MVFASDIDKLRSLQEEAKFYQIDDMIVVSENEIENLLKDDQRVPVIIADLNQLKSTTKSPKYVVLEENGVSRTYKILDLIHVYDNLCNTNCFRCTGNLRRIPKFISRPTNKKLI